MSHTLTLPGHQHATRRPPPAEIISQAIPALAELARGYTFKEIERLVAQ